MFFDSDYSAWLEEKKLQSIKLIHRDRTIRQINHQVLTSKTSAAGCQPGSLCSSAKAVLKVEARGALIWEAEDQAIKDEEPSKRRSG